MKRKSTREDIQKKVEELIDLIKRYKGNKSGQAAYACFEIVNWIAKSYYEAIGILSDTIMEYKKACDALEEGDLAAAEKIKEALREVEEKTKLQ